MFSNLLKPTKSPKTLNQSTYKYNSGQGNRILKNKNKNGIHGNELQEVEKRMKMFQFKILCQLL